MIGLVPVVLAAAGAGAFQVGLIRPRLAALVRPAPSSSVAAAAPAAAAVYVPTPGQALPFEICYYNGSWKPPDADTEATHLQQDPRYTGLDLAHRSLERVHVELGPYRSASAFGDFVQLSGLWTDPNATSAACPADLQGKAELWALELHFSRFELSGRDMTAFVSPVEAGVEAVQVSLPAAAEALHVIDDKGAKQAPDVSLTLG